MSKFVNTGAYNQTNILKGVNFLTKLNFQQNENNVKKTARFLEAICENTQIYNKTWGCEGKVPAADEKFLQFLQTFGSFLKPFGGHLPPLATPLCE